ncbi:hypothetical protein [Kibdelosporangium phytohabitans]|uniref:Uncharacterized protein n=1 Tax=Kibdelosporangium phytohabitans TaxID=860235 RepID=A0A0N9I0S6_9PSEU|nr:hypothetical protein [Kibdelosporangium phytohabitans]ALG09606.1 hypothetical protein AOZ06_24290 [Kibdelosporangium phytohabitans]MBE1469057.1 hypothetical protein [Kibdelosporangium phytohabitans]
MHAEPVVPVNVVLLGADSASTSALVDRAAQHGWHLRYPKSPDGNGHHVLLWSAGEGPRVELSATAPAGHVLHSRASSPSLVALRNALDDADVVCLVLDGDSVQDWFSHRDVQRTRRRLRVHEISMLVRATATDRMRSGHELPALVLAVTSQVDGVTVNALRELVPVAFSSGADTLVALPGNAAAPFHFAVGHVVAGQLAGRGAALHTGIGRLDALTRQITGTRVGSRKRARLEAQRGKLSAGLVAEQEASARLRHLMRVTQRRLHGLPFFHDGRTIDPAIALGRRRYDA